MEVQQDRTGDKADIEPSGSATETDRFGFILGNGINPGDGPSPVLVRHREVKWLSIISQWDDVSQRRSSKVKGQCQKGIPASLRAKCWPLLCGATQRMRYNQKLYQTLDEAPALQNWVDVIERDTDRQFPFHEMFLSKDGHGQRGLFRVLKAYTQFRPDEGYCQAQGPVAAVLLMNMPTEEAFWCLVQISELYLPGYYSPLLEGVLFDAGMLPWVLKKACPAAHRHLLRQGVEPLMFATDWLMCLYTRHLPFSTLLRVWDLFFCYGVRVLFQVAVVLVRRVLGRGDQREECDGQMETLERLRGVKEYLQHEDADAFIQEVCSVSLSEKDLQRRTEKELDNWRKERPNSTFDPRGRCHGYMMAWERVKEMEEKQEKKAKEKGNLSLPLRPSPSSLSPSLLRKKWKKRGSKAADEGEGSAGEQTIHGDKHVENRKHSDGSTSSMDSHHQTTALDKGTEEPDINTPNPLPSKEGGHCRTSSDGSVGVAASERAQTYTHTDQQSRPSNRNSGITTTKEGPSESEGDRQEKKVHTQSSHEEGEGISEEESQTEEDRGRVEEEIQEDENKHHGPQKTELENEIQILKDKEELIVEGKEETVIVRDKPEEDIQILADKLEEEMQTVKAEEVEEMQTAKAEEVKEMQTVQDKQVEVMKAAENRPAAGMQSVKDEHEEEATVTHKSGLESLKDEQETTQSHTDQQETCDSIDTKEGQTSTDQEEWQGQEDQGQEMGQANTPHGQTGEVGQTEEEEEEEVTQTEVTCEDDLHTQGDEESERVKALSTSKQEEEVQPDDEVVEKKGEEDKVETDVSSPGQALQPQDSVSSLSTPPVEDDLNSDPPPPQPQSSPDADLSAEMENSQTDVGPLLEGENQCTHSPLVDRHSEAPAATKPTVEEQDQPREKEAITEAAEGCTEYTDHETQEHMVVMEETMGSSQEKASVNTSATSTQEICSSFPSRPQSTIGSSGSPQSSAANKEGQATEAEQLSTPNSTISTQLTETDTSKPPNGIEIHPNNQSGSEEHLLSQSENAAHTAETESHSDIDTSREEVVSRPEGEISKTQEAEEMSDPISLSNNSPDRTDSKELCKESEKEKTERIVAEENKEHAGTEEASSSSQNSSTKSIAERDSVASVGGAETANVTTFPEPATGTTRASEAQPPPTGQVRVRRYSNSRSSYPRVLSEDIFKDPRDIPLEDNTIPPQPQSPAKTEGPFATPIPESPHSPASRPKNSSHTQGTTQSPLHTHSPSKSQTLNPAEMGKLTESPKRLGLFQRLRGGAKSSTTHKMTIPKILIQDFSEEAEDEAQLSSKERRKRRRERERREKEEEKLRKKQEKEKEKDQERERKKPQTRGKSFQLPSSTFRAKDSTLKRSESQNVVSRRNSTPLSDNYF